MKPTTLKPGQKVINGNPSGGHTMVFVRRIPGWRLQSGEAVNIFRCDAYRGLVGPTDDGTVNMSDQYVSKYIQPAAI